MSQRTPSPRGGPVKQAGGGRVARVAAGAALFAARRPGSVLVLVALSGGGLLFSWNALMKQPSPHPAPLFASAKPVPPVEPPRRPDFLAGQAASPPARAEATPPAKPMADASVKTASNDAIGNLIRGGDPTSSRSPDAKPASAPPARVVSAQKALAKLGYGPIESDGVYGSVTRQAIERFEKDRNIPVTGSLGQKTLKHLAARSGIQVE